MTNLHHVPGRLRVRLADLKRNAAMARSLEASVRSVPGVQTAETNTTTGSLIVRYDPGAVSPETLLGRLRDRGYPVATVPPAGVVVSSPSVPARLARRAGKAVFVFALEKAIERSVPLAIAALL